MSRNRSTAADVDETASERIFDEPIRVCLRQVDREEETPHLGLSIFTGGRMARYVRLRLTDPRDPFFLFQVILLENEYGVFKERHELHVDFAGFPRDLVSMLRNERYSLYFHADHGDQGILRIMQRTDFRSLELLSLTLVRQGDAGQKQYLAEQFVLFHDLYHQQVDECRSHSSQYDAKVRRLEERLVELQAERTALSEQSLVAKATSHSELSQTVSSLKDEHLREMKSTTSEFDRERQRLQQQIDALSAKMQSQGRQHDADVAKLRGQLTDAEGRVATLTSRLQSAGEQLTLAQQQAASARQQCEELVAYRENAERQLINFRLTEVTLTERLNNATREATSKGEEAQHLRSQLEKADTHARATAQQLSDANDKNKQLDASVGKARHVMAALHRRNEAQREQLKLLQETVSSNESWLGEKNNAIEKLQLELEAKDRHVRQLEEHESALRGQLAKAEEDIQRLVQNVKQHETALVNLHRTQTHFAPRYMATSLKDLARGMQASSLPMSSLQDATNVSHGAAAEKPTPRTGRTFVSPVGSGFESGGSHAVPPPAVQSAYFPVGETAR